MVSLAHGTNDAQKTMGVITLALIANGTLAAGGEGAVLGHPLLRAGHQHRYLPGRLAGDPHAGQGPGRDRVAAGHGGRVLVGRDHPAVQPASATRCPPPTSPPGRSSAPGSARRAPRSAGAWPAGWPPPGCSPCPPPGSSAPALTGSPTCIGGSLGVIILLIILVAIAAGIYLRSRANKVDHNNVNDEWTGTVAPAEPEPAQRPERQGSEQCPGSTCPRCGRSWCSACIAGAGLPALFAVGLYALSSQAARAQTAGADSDHVYGGNVAGPDHRRDSVS